MVYKRNRITIVDEREGISMELDRQWPFPFR